MLQLWYGKCGYGFWRVSEIVFKLSRLRVVTGYQHDSDSREESELQRV